MKVNGLQLLFQLQVQDGLRLEDEVAGVALRLGSSTDEPNEASHLVNYVQMCVTKFTNNVNNRSYDSFEVKEAVSSYLSVTFTSLYDRHIEQARNMSELNKKISSRTESKEQKVDDRIERQKEVDLLAINQIIY